MPYKHLKQEDRVVLGALLRAGHKQADIARHLNKHRSTICRELRRNHLPNKSGYHAASARLKTIERRRIANQHCRKLTFNKHLQRKLERKLRRGWSPEQVAHRSGAISHMTIYRWVYEERLDLKKCLRSRKDKYRRKHGTAAREHWRERQKKRWIDDRPAIVNTRDRFGDWKEIRLLVQIERVPSLLTLNVRVDTSS